MFNKKLVAAAAASGLMALVSAAFAQVAYEDALPSQSVEVTAPANPDRAHILYFVDQGNSPETDPAAHLALIKDVQQPQPAVAAVEQPTVVAQAEPAPAAEPVPAPTQEAAPPQTENLTEKSTAPDDSAAMPAPRADRN